MRKIVLATLALLFFVSTADAGVLRVGYKVVKNGVKVSAKVVKGAAKVAYKVAY